MRTGDGTVRIAFRNSRDTTVRIRIGETRIWCGGSAPGEGRAIETRIGSFLLEAGTTGSREQWGVRCDATRFFVEFQGMKIAEP